MRQRLAEPDFSGDLVYKLKKIVGSNIFSAQFIKIISHYKKNGYIINVLQQTACLVVNLITVGNFELNSINYSFETGSLTELQKQSIITIIPKQNKDLTILDNWRPISLLNVDYKIATKIIANRVKHVITNIIHNSQTGLLKGRYIGENIRLLFEIIDNAEEENKPGLIFFSDFEKAFDSVDHTYKISCLKHFNFGEDFMKWVKLFNNDAKSCVTNNGNLSDVSLFCEVFVRDVPFHLSLHHMY